mgnify:CR=1 FL=1
MSTKQINPFYELKIKEGKSDELRAIAKEMVAFNRDGEPNTEIYNVYVSEDKKLLTYWETHADSEALMFHADRFANGDYIGQVLERTEGARLCLYGEVSQQMKHWAAENGFEVEYAELVDGFQRQR